MASATPEPAVPFRPQDYEEVAEMLRGLESNKGYKKSRGGFSCKKNTYDVDHSKIKVDAWKLQDWDYKKPNLPTYARGLFTTRTSKGRPEIVARGYDKFFNHGEVRETEWRNIETSTRGPYELSVKENGCIIFIAGLEDGNIVVCSKHSIGGRADLAVSHAQAGEKWLEKHLSTVGRTRQQLAAQLRKMNATAVAELCDDEFEEHVLAYTPETAGLYLHGINLNLPEFATYPHEAVDRFAEEWGFKKTQYLVKHDIADVKTFLDTVAETGNYNGRDTEGFVIRCQSNANTGIWHDWFFKYKFEEPYLMYRQWRECTKAIIACKEPRYRQHKAITAEYLVFARKQLRDQPGLAKAYQSNHGIIKMRDDFLAYRGLSGADIIRQEAEAGEVANDAVTRDVVLVPVATIGCGKTTVALALCRLFGWGHVQNDNIVVRKGKPQAFAHACTGQLIEHDAVVADRNNHQRRERKQIMEDIARTVPHARFVALQYVHDRDNHDRIREATRARVLNRGDNHQTIQANSKDHSEIIGIMEGFMQRFESIDVEMPPDDGFDTVINLDAVASSRENLETVVTKLYNEYPQLFKGQEMPSSDDMDAAVNAALNDYTVDIKHEIKGGSAQKSSKQSLPTRNAASNGAPKEKPVEYFAVQLPAQSVNAILDGLFRETAPAVAKMYHMLKQTRRIQHEFHVTLIHRVSAGQFPDEWARLKSMQDDAVRPSAERPYPLPNPVLGCCNVRFERLVWNTRLMAFVVRLSPAQEMPNTDAATPTPPFRSVNATAHITVGTANADIKPKESNDLLARWLQAGSGEESGIMELAVKGHVEMEGNVRAVLSR